MLIIPLGTKGSTGFPVATLFICVACIIIYAFTLNPLDQLALAYYPDSLNPLKMFTACFAHGDIWHLLGNLFFFYCFSRTIETQISFLGYLLAFVLFALATHLAYSATATLPIPTLGLSGVVWGFMGIFLLRYPGEFIETWMLFIGKIGIPAFIFILAFLAFDVIGFRNAEVARINYVAHFSGFAAGALFKVLFWRTFTTEKPSPKKLRPAGRYSPSRTPRR
jgi:membrane associated rhomboid family serine protease